MVDVGKDWRAFSNEEYQSRAHVGIAITPTRINYGLDTSIVSGGESKKITEKLKRAQRRVTSGVSREKALRIALKKLRRVAVKLNLPPAVYQDAAILYRKASAKGLVKGRSMDSMLAAVVYAACRRTHTPRNLREVAEHFKMKEKEVGRSLRFLFKEIGIQIPPPRPTDYVSRIASKLKLPDKLVARSLQILKVAKEVGVTMGKEPCGVAAAAVYLACQEAGIHKTQRELAGVAGVTEVTVRNRFKELLEKVKPILDQRRR